MSDNKNFFHGKNCKICKKEATIMRFTETNSECLCDKCGNRTFNYTVLVELDSTNK